MAIAYHSWIATASSLDPIKEDDESVLIQLQNQAEQEVIQEVLTMDLAVVHARIIKCFWLHDV